MALHSKRLEQFDRAPGRVDLPPLVAVSGGARIGVMIVMPALAGRDNSNDRVIAAGVVSLVVAIIPDVSRRIDQPSDMPDQLAEAELQGLPGRAAKQQFGSESASEKNNSRGRHHGEPERFALQPNIKGVAQDVLGVAIGDTEPREFPQ